MEEKQFPTSLNYLYFGFFFLFLMLISASSILTKQSSSSSHFFFFLYASGQALLEICLLVFCGWVIQHISGKVGFISFIGATFVFFVLHMLDFAVERILDLSIWQTIGFLFDESLENFLYLLDASGVALWIWILFFCFILLLPFLGILIYLISEKIIQNRQIFLKKEWLFQIFICIPIALLLWEHSTSQLIHPNSYTGFSKSLPWKFTFLQPSTIFFPLSKFLKEPIQEEIALASIKNDTTQLTTKPNIYLFVVESLREDFITREVAPYLYQFKQDTHHFDLALSNSNGTHLSWFSIFHSQLPYYWNQVQKNGWKIGSPPIHLLKKWGYKVRLYASAQLGYYGMGKLLFGEDHYLVDSFQTFHHAPPLSASDSDAQAVSQLQEDLKDPSLQEGQLIIVFLDSTHFDYSWPKSEPLKFSPIAKQFAFFRLFHSEKNIEKIKNRYRNSVFYIDSLFAQFMKTLPQKEEAIIIVTGDHGEEFFERGNLFHCSHLVHQQTNIPLYMKLGTKKQESSSQLVSQIDIFPTIFDHLSQKKFDFLAGSSIFDPQRPPYAILARFNAGRTPYEFCIHNGHYKFIAQFTDKKNIFQSKELKIKSLSTYNDDHITTQDDQIDTWIETQFGKALRKITENSSSDLF